MELLIISTCSAIFIALFTLLRIPLNRWTVPTASIGGIIMVFALIQVLNYYHPYSGVSRQHLTATQLAPDIAEPESALPLVVGEYNLVVWFHQNNLLRLEDGSAAEVTFDHIPGKVFSGKLRRVLPVPDEDLAWAPENGRDTPGVADQPRIPVVIDISDPRYNQYFTRVPGGSRAQAAVYGEELQELALVRKTLLRMSAWMNYLTPLT